MRFVPWAVVLIFRWSICCDVITLFFSFFRGKWWGSEGLGIKLTARHWSGQCELGSFPACCVGSARQRDIVNGCGKGGVLRGLQHPQTQRTYSVSTPQFRRWESVCVWGAPRIGHVTVPWKKKRNLQRGVLGQHRQVFSVLEFYSLHYRVYFEGLWLCRQGDG